MQSNQILSNPNPKTHQNKLGIMGCLACRSNPCNWRPVIDPASAKERSKEIDEEIERVRSDPFAESFSSSVPLCVQLANETSRKFKREDLLDELYGEGERSLFNLFYIYNLISHSLSVSLPLSLSLFLFFSLSHFLSISCNP